MQDPEIMTQPLHHAFLPSVPVFADDDLPSTPPAQKRAKERKVAKNRKARKLARKSRAQNRKK
jgi:hypothetical protein